VMGPRFFVFPFFCRRWRPFTSPNPAWLIRDFDSRKRIDVQSNSARVASKGTASLLSANSPVSVSPK
jgi:hypothetical protein